MVVGSFLAIALMRVVQQICSKQVSNEVEGNTFFHYGAYYNLMSAIFSVITVCIVGWYGFTWETVLCAFGTAVFMAIELFAGIEALKGCSLIINQMFTVSSLIIPCVVGIFLFGEPMSVWQWLGLALFICSMYFMVSTDKQKKDAQKISLKTLVMLLLVMLSSGGTMVVQKAFGISVPNGNTALYTFLIFAITAIFLYLFYGLSTCVAGKTERNGDAGIRRTKPLSKKLLVCGAFLAFAVFVINLLVTELGKTVPSAILFSVSYAICILITLLVGCLYYKEKITWRNIMGIVLCVGALSVINFL